MIVETRGLAVGGEAIARAEDGRVVFVEGAAPNETVRVEVVKHKRRFASARTIEIIAASPDRVEPACPHFGVCGGCALQHVRAEAQSREKAAAALEAIRRIARTPGPQTVEPSWSGPAYGYRARARWLVSQGRLGYRARRSHHLVEIEACPILVPVLEGSLDSVKAALSPLTEAEIFVLAAQNRVLVWPKPAIRGDAWPSGGIELVPPGKGVEVEDAGGRAFVGPGTFAQANPHGNDAMLTTLARWLDPTEVALELYSGSGNFTRVVEKSAQRVVAVETDGAAVRLAGHVRGPDTETWRTDARAALERARTRGLDVGLLLVNPPRTGLDQSAPGAIGELSPPVLVYVSCDPATFARDLGRLSAFGYRLDRARLFDLYPQTPHLEVMARLVRSEEG